MSKVLTFGIAVAVVACAAVALGQDTGTTNGGQSGQTGTQQKSLRDRHNRQAGLLKQLNLTKEQQAKIKEIAKKTREAVVKLKEEKGDRKQMRAKLQEIRKKQLDEIREVLTPEQREKLDKLIKERREKNKAGVHPGKS